MLSNFSIQCVQSSAALTLPDFPALPVSLFFSLFFFVCCIDISSPPILHTILNHLQNHNLLQPPSGSVQLPSFHLFSHLLMFQQYQSFSLFTRQLYNLYSRRFVELEYHHILNRICDAKTRLSPTLQYKYVTCGHATVLVCHSQAPRIVCWEKNKRERRMHVWPRTGVLQVKKNAKCGSQDSKHERHSSEHLGGRLIYFVVDRKSYEKAASRRGWILKILQMGRFNVYIVSTKPIQFHVHIKAPDSFRGSARSTSSPLLLIVAPGHPHDCYLVHNLLCATFLVQRLHCAQ